MKTRTVMFVFACAIAWASGNAQAAPMGTAFAYQGRLTEAGVPLDATVDFRFALWDALSGGTQVESVESVPNVDVVNGLFCVQLDFGASPLNGDARWLEIAVRRPAGSGSFTTLSPRQPLTPAPYALYALGGPGGGGGFWTANGNDIVNTNSGNVGIGATLPTEKLTVAGTLQATRANAGRSDDQDFFVQASDRGSEFHSPAATIGTKVRTAADLLTRFWMECTPGVASLTRTSGSDLHIRTGGAPGGLFTGQMTIAADGSVGIGTTSPKGRLHLSSPEGIDLIVSADTDNAGGEDQNARIVMRQDGGQVAARVGFRGGTNKLEIMQEYGDSLILGTSNTDHVIVSAGGDVQLGADLAIDGNVGIGTTDPDARIHMLEFGNEMLFNMTAFGTGQGGRIAVTSQTNPNPALVISHAGAAPALDVVGTARANVVEITGGADLAEPFHVAGTDVGPGRVVVIDADHPGRLKLSAQAYDRRVAGVISGAGGIRPGMLMGQRGTAADGEQHVALTGRVYCWCDAGNGPIEPGDLLTTSDTPGHAMKVTDHARAHGAILGKAMTPCSQGRGLVLVLVSLH